MQGRAGHLGVGMQGAMHHPRGRVIHARRRAALSPRLSLPPWAHVLRVLLVYQAWTSACMFMTMNALIAGQGVEVALVQVGGP